MLLEAILFLISLIIFALIITLLFYYIITFSDLEADYLNVQECCNRLNFWVVPKFGIHIFIILLLIFDSQWLLILFNVPLVIWLGYELYKQPKHSLGLYDPIEIYNRGMLNTYLRNSIIYLVYYFILFFMHLFYFLRALIKDDPIRRHENDMIIDNSNSF